MPAEDLGPDDTDIPDDVTPSALGVIYLPTGAGTGVGTFEFIVSPDSKTAVEIGTPVAADTSEGTLVGAVVDMRTVGYHDTPAHASFGGTEIAEIAPRPEVVVAKVQIFYTPYLRSPRAGKVRAASSKEMLDATGYARMDWPIASGVVPMADGTYGKVCFDGTSLLGPEAAHLMVGGLSGQAAKTSYMGVLLKSAMAAGIEGHGVAALIFNVKGTDLLYLDEPPAAGYELSDDDHAMYEALGIPSTPFEDVLVYAPSLPGGDESRSERSDAMALRWDLPRVWQYLQYFFPNIWEDELMRNFTNQFADLLLFNQNPQKRIDTFDKLEAWFDGQIEEAQGKDGKESNDCWGGRVHIATMRRMRRSFMGIPSRCGGLVTRESATDRDDLPTKNWSHGQVIVVDIAGLHADIQAIVIARTLERLLKSAEDGELGVDHLIVMADELNAFAPAQGAEMGRVRKILQRVSTLGRYAGISLWGAAQKLSKVDELVRDNAATRACGILADAELGSGVYGRVPTGLAERLATLPRGQMALWHYSFRSALVVRFPRPAWRTGKAKTSGGRPTLASTLKIGGKKLSAKARARLMEGMPDDVVDDIIARMDDGERAVDELASRRVPDMSEVALYEETTVDVDDPYAL